MSYNLFGKKMLSPETYPQILWVLFAGLYDAEKRYSIKLYVGGILDDAFHVCE